MDLRFNDEETAFREEVRRFLVENLPDDIRQRTAEGMHADKDDLVTWTRILNRKGWAVPHWPVEFGGTGWGPVKQYIFQEETQRFPAPQPLAFGVTMVAPIIFTFGNDTQKQRFLPRIANLDDWWCQGFSEPGSGSDLASLSTRAVRDGDDYVVNGQKTWTSFAQHADWMFALVRTDPQAKKQEGISFLLIDMRSPGIEVRPIRTVGGGHEVNEVFFTDVRVPVENRVGVENRGWDYAKFLLGNERTNIARIGMSKQRIAQIRAAAASQMSGGRPLSEDPRFREKLLSIEIDLKALEFTQLRVVSADAKRGPRGEPDPASSILKIKATEIQQALMLLHMQVIGPYAAAMHANDLEGVNWLAAEPAFASNAAARYFNGRKVTIYGGSSEIQKSIIAKSVLGF
jgi:pimeloyl-CoA dehydrogenase large subunit